MKQFLFALTLIAGFAAQAQTAPDFKIRKGDKILRAITEAEVVNTEVIGHCPEGAMCLVATQTVFTVKVPLASCVNTLSPVGYNVRVIPAREEIAGRVVIELTGFEVMNEAATRVRCQAPAFKLIRVSSYGNLEDIAVDVRSQNFAN